MKKTKALLLMTLAMTLLLTSCTGMQTASSWPGLAAQQNTVFVAYGNGVMAVNSNDGSKIWNYPEKADPARQFFASPTFLNGQVLVGDYGNTLHSLDVTSGAEKWSFAESTGRYIAGPLVIGDLILAPSVDNTLYAVNTQGRLEWKYPVQNDIWASPVSDGQKVYIAGMDHNIYAIRLGDHTPAWSVNLGASILSAPALSSDGVLYVATLGKEVVALDTTGGAVLWKYSTTGSIWASPVLKENTVYIGDIEKNFYAVNAKNGESVWKVEMPSAVYGAAAVTPGGLVIAMEGGDLVALSFKGEKIWSQRINGKLYTAPVIAGEKVFVAVKDSEKLLFAYDFNGKELWSLAVPK